MSSRMNGYVSEREYRPSSEQMSDLHVYLVPQDIWREKFNNALNQYIDNTVSLGFIRVHPETRVSALRDEIEAQLGSDLIPREYVFVKSVGRSLTRLKARQENTLKAKNFLPPQAYAPELYLLEATPEVKQALSEGSTRPETRTSYDYELQRQNPSQHQMVSSSRRMHQQDKRSDEYPTPLSATPPNTANEKNRSGHNVSHGNRNKHNDDSGIAGFTPETYKDSHFLDRRKPDSDENDQVQPTSSINDDSDRSNRSQNDDKEQKQHYQQQRKEQQRNDSGERQDRDDEERQRREDQEEEEPDRYQGQDDIKNKTKLARTLSEEDLTRYPSPPPLRLASPDRDTASAQTQRRKEKEELLKELERSQEARKLSERQREELVKQAKVMQSKTQSRRSHARDLWKKRYFEEKKKTGPLEEQCNRLRHELDILHKKLLTTLEGPKEKATKLSDIKPSNKNNFKIQATRLQHEIEDVRRRVDHAKMKLTSEMKLRNQAETELRALRAELMQKKINLTLSRNSQLTSYAPPASDVNMYTNRSGITPRS